MEFRSKEDCANALDKLNETMLDGRKIYLKLVSVYTFKLTFYYRILSCISSHLWRKSRLDLTLTQDTGEGWVVVADMKSDLAKVVADTTGEVVQEVDLMSVDLTIETRGVAMGCLVAEMTQHPRKETHSGFQW